MYFIFTDYLFVKYLAVSLFLITGKQLTKSESIRSDFDLILVLLNLFNFEKTKFTTLFLNLVKHNKLGYNGCDKNHKPRYEKSLFTNKWNFYKYCFIILDFIHIMMKYLLKEQDENDKKTQKLKSHAISLLIQTQTDIENLQTFLKIYFNNINIKAQQFFNYLNNVFAVAFEQGEYLSTTASRPDLLDLLRPITFSQTNCDKNVQSESTSTKIKSENTTTTSFRQTNYQRNHNNK